MSKNKTIFSYTHSTHSVELFCFKGFEDYNNKVFFAVLGWNIKVKLLNLLKIVEC